MFLAACEQGKDLPRPCASPSKKGQRDPLEFGGQLRDSEEPSPEGALGCFQGACKTISLFDFSQESSDVSRPPTHR